MSLDADRRQVATAGAETRSSRRAVWASPGVNSSAPRIWYVVPTEN
jgi:hypothetical protein